MEEQWPSCRLHTLQASLFQRFGLLAQAEREWRSALECKPLGRPLDAQLRINFEMHIRRLKAEQQRVDRVCVLRAEVRARRHGVRLAGP